VPSTAAGPATAMAAQVLPAAQVNPLGMVSDVVSRVVSGLLAWVGLGPSMTAVPAAPVQSVGLWGLLAWVRREVQRTFFNQTPTIGYDPALNRQALDGVVTGDLNAVDPDGDPLSLSVVEAPTHGTVVINRDGTFTYVPDPDFARTGGTDEFTVMAADTGFHLHGPGGVFAPDFGHTGKSVVEVDVGLVAIKTTIDVGDHPYGVAVSPNGDTAYVTNEDDGTVSVIDTDTDTDTVTATITATITVAPSPRGVVVSPNGTRAYVASLSGKVSVINTNTDTVIATVTINGPLRGLAISPDGAHVYVTNVVGDRLTVIDAGSNTVVATVTVGDHPVGVAVSPDGTRLYVTNFGDNTVSAIELP